MTTGAQELKSYSKLSPVKAGLDFAGHWVAIVCIFVVAHNYPSIPMYLVAMFLIAGLQHGLINLQHDAWHMLCFKKRWLNDLIGAWFYAYPVGMPYFHERFRHLDHHKYFNTTNDPDWVTYNNSRRGSSSQLFQFFGGRFFGSLLTETLVPIVLRGKSRIAPVEKIKSGPSTISEYARVAVVQLILLGSFALAGRFWEYIVLWFVPLVTIAAFFVSLRAFLEHASIHDEAPDSERLFDFNPPLIEKFFLSPADFNYHAVHHAYPTVPHFRLKDVRKYLHEKQISYPNRQVSSYSRFFLDHLKKLETKISETKNSESKTFDAIATDLMVSDPRAFDVKLADAKTIDARISATPSAET
ncbi:MAG: fatty acid desaturase family protein [Candidatus Melainabacteria bacterium]|nr:fatty acid desaturase family protein [Candidatus Melainabacteria bacterium]